ncbi:hypothetical protein ACFQPF_17770 [Fictibacillus iocasae]|uniref:Dimethylamine monooxygenase subunit DmmA-like C-terminal domain-containing protein n=1 Tax=Fictibacillus iocasae TaxID=2715437 RepID=A0ABW2NX01_9BACL
MKKIVITDEQGITVLRHIFQHSMSVEWLPLDDSLGETLSQQKMGTTLHVALPWKQLKKVRKAAEAAGFSDEHSEYIGYGEKEQRVFCCRCHAIGTSDVQCASCGLILDLSDHYSTLHDAYLAYPVFK